MLWADAVGHCSLGECKNAKTNKKVDHAAKDVSLVDSHLPNDVIYPTHQSGRK